MRKFLDFVVRDDLPILTPPSEIESGYELEVDGCSNGHQTEASVEPTAADQVNNLKHRLVKAVPVSDGAKASQESSDQTDLHELNPTLPFGMEHEKEREGKESLVTFATVASGQTNTPNGGTSDGVSFGDVHEKAECRVTAAETVFPSGHSTMRKQATKDVHDTVAESSNVGGSQPSVREPLSRSDDRLRNAARILSSFASDGVKKASKSRDEERLRETRVVVNALREIAETMVWADQHEHSLWDTFMECSIMPLFLRCLRSTVASHAGGDMVYAGCFNGTSGGARDSESTFRTSHQNEGKEQLYNGKQSANRAGEVLPDCTDGKKELDSPSSLTPGGASSSLNTRIADVSARYEPASEGATEVSVNKGPDQSSEQIALEIQSQVLQTLSIMIQSVFRQQSLLCLFSSNHINEILSFGFRFEGDEMLGYFMSAVKTIALKLDPALLQLFFDPSRGTFPLYNTVVRFFDHREQMVRIAVRNITLTIYALGDPEVLDFAARDESMYLYKTVNLLAKLCCNVARAFELLMDDGREIHRTRSRTGIFRQKVRKSEVSGKLEEIENLFAYLGDVSTVSKDRLRPVVARLLSSKLLSPLFRPLASRASPNAIRLQKRWRLTDMALDTCTPALPVFDAAARCLLLACILKTCNSSCLGQELMRELVRCTSEFEDRSVLHALKAMASDKTGTERVSFVSLCAIEAFILSDATTKEHMRSLKYDFDSPGPSESFRALERFNGSFSDGANHVEGEHKKSLDESLLMTLSEFEAPLTPSNSLPSTPKYVPPSPSDSATPPKGLTRLMSAPSLSTDGVTSQESSESTGVLTTFHLGEASLRETVSSLILVVRRREVRTLRTVHAICRVISAVGSKTSDYNLCFELTKVILNEIAGVMQSFLRNKRTTIVSIERMFENFRSVAEQDPSEYTTILSLGQILSPDAAPEVASDYPKGAGKRRRALKDDTTSPTEIEDALALFVMLYAHERALDNIDKVEVARRIQTSRSSDDRLSIEVRNILLSCNLDESYLEKREALQDVADTVLREGP